MSRLVPWNKLPKESGDVPVALISLDGATSRREELVKRGFSREWVQGYWPATDLRFTSQEDLNRNATYKTITSTYGRDILPGELGCLFSHRAVIDWFSENSEASLLVVFEDDAIPTSLDFSIKLSALVAVFEEKAKSGEAFVCHLGPPERQWKRSFSRKISSRALSAMDIALYRHFDKERQIWLAHAYVISKEAAIRYSQSSVKHGFMADDWRRIIDQSGMAFFSVFPGIFSQADTSPSSIDPSGIRVIPGSRDPLYSLSKLKKSFRSGSLDGNLGQLAWRMIRILLVVFLRRVPLKNRF